MAMDIREPWPNEYDDVVALFAPPAPGNSAPSGGSESVGFGSASVARLDVRRLLERHGALSLVARDGQRILGVVLCEQVGKRGCIQHLALCGGDGPEGLAKLLVEKATVKLRALGIHKCRLHVAARLELELFWRSAVWTDPCGRSLGKAGDVASEPQPPAGECR